MIKSIQFATLSSVFLAALFLPFSTTFSNIALGILLLSTVLSYLTLGINLSLFRRKSFYVYTTLLFFIPILVGIIYSPMTYATFREVKRMLFLAVLPLLGLRCDLNPRNLLKQAANGLVWGSVISALFLLVVNFYNFMGSSGDWTSLFSYNYTSFHFTAPVHLHPIYLGSYYVMALVFVFNQTRPQLPLKRGLTGLCTVILLMGVLFLNSRIIYGITFIICLLFLIENVSWKLTALLVAFLIVSFAIIFPKVNKTYLLDKLISGTRWELSENVGTYNTDNKYPADSRLSRWEVGWELIKENPIIGTGTGTERGELGNKFKENHMKVSYESRYNAHNQFIGFAIRFGVFGLLLMLIYFFSNFFTAVHNKDLAFLCFLFIIFSIFLVENYIDRNMGIDFVALLGTLFYLQYHYTENQKRKSRLL